MRKSVKLIACLAMMLMMLCSCGPAEEKIDPAFEKFTGKWQCAESPLEHEDYYTGFLVLAMEENGEFRMYDVEAGNPGISGKMKIESETELALACDTDEDFDPPPTWMTLEPDETLTYEFVSETELHLSFEGEEGMSTLVFSKN